MSGQDAWIVAKQLTRMPALLDDDRQIYINCLVTLAYFYSTVSSFDYFFKVNA